MSKIKHFFDTNPDANEVFETSDGYLFFKRTDAEAHAKSLKERKEVEHITKADMSKKIASEKAAKSAEEKARKEADAKAKKEAEELAKAEAAEAKKKADEEAAKNNAAPEVK